MTVPSPDHCLSVAELTSAATGSLDPARGSHLRACPLCSAAYEGLELAEETTRRALLAEADARPAGALTEAHVVRLGDRSPEQARHLNTRRTWAWVAIAAAAGLLLLVGIRHDALRAPGALAAAEGLPQGAFYGVVEPFARRQRSGESVAPTPSPQGVPPADLTQADDPYFPAASAYERGEYADAAAAYRDALRRAQSPLLDTRGYYELGITHWRLGRLDSAADYLTRARMGEVDYFEDATWALARVYLLRKDTLSARVPLGDLARLPRSPYADDAARLLDDLSTTR